MSQETILAALDASIATGKKTLRVAIGIGITFILAGLACYLFLENDNVPIAAIVGGIGLLLTVICAVALIKNSIGKRTEQVKHIIRYQPHNLVWSYVMERTINNAKSISVVMNFRDGTDYVVGENTMPGRDTSAFLRSLQNINPEMQVGYNEELNKRFKEKAL